MPRFLLDSGIASAYINGRDNVYERARVETLKGNRIGIAVPVLAELVSGIERSQTRDRNLQALRSALPSLKLWPFDEAAAFEFGRLHAELLRLGRPMQVIDIMVAAVALSLGQTTVVTTDSDLSAVPGLIVVDWTKAP